MYSDKTLTLNNGIKISQIQLGTWLINNDDVKKLYVRQLVLVTALLILLETMVMRMA